jgi:hypothetical protein
MPPVEHQKQLQAVRQLPVEEAVVPQFRQLQQRAAVAGLQLSVAFRLFAQNY